VDPLGEDVGGEQQTAFEDGGVVADADLTGRRFRQRQAQPLQEREFAAQEGLRRSVGETAAW